VEELSASLSNEEFEDWMMYYSVEPFGSPAEDDRFRNLLAISYSAAGGKDHVDWLDRDPEWTATLRERAEPPLEDKLEAYFEMRMKAQEEDDLP
jgi:hypothetical protein